MCLRVCKAGMFLCTLYTLLHAQGVYFFPLYLPISGRHKESTGEVKHSICSGPCATGVLKWVQMTFWASWGSVSEFQCLYDWATLVPESEMTSTLT